MWGIAPQVVHGTRGLMLTVERPGTGAQGLTLTSSREVVLGGRQDGRIRINQRLSIPRSELELRASRSGGPGGQHANTSATRIQLFWNVRASPSLSDRRRQLILSRLAGRIDGSGVLQLAADTHRSQYRNRQEVIERFVALVAEALRPTRTRRPTRPTGASREKRLAAKKRRGRIKRLRGRVEPED